MIFVLAVLTGMGVGSGGLYILYHTLIKDTPQAIAQGLNFAFFITASLGALAVNLKNGKISFYHTFILLPFGIFGAVVGAKLAVQIDRYVLSIIFGVMLIFVGFAGLVKILKK